MYTNVSSEFLEVLARPSRHFAARFKDNGTVIDLEIKNLKATMGTCGGGSLAVGCAYAAYIDVTALYTDMLLEGKELSLELGLLLDDESYEWIPFGYWTVQKPKKSMDTMTFQAVDRMAGKLHADYETALTYPATIQAVLDELETNTGLTVHCNLQTTQQITVPIEGVTQRGALAIIAATLLGNAWIDRNGDVQITSIGGGTSVKVNYDYVKGQPEMDEDATVIEGVKVFTVAGQTDTWIERGSGNTVEVSDVYMTDTILDAVKANLIGLSYGGGEVSFMGNPLIDPSDIVYFRGGSDMVEYFLITDQGAEITDEEDANLVGFDFTTYDIPCLEITQSFDGGLLTTINAPGKFEATEQTYTVGAVTEELRRQAKEIAQNQTDIDTVSGAVTAAQQTADNAMTTANGKNKIFYQNKTTNPPQGMSEGDLLFDTGGGNALWEYKKTGSNPDTYAWTLRQLGQGSIAAGSITANEINVNNLSAIRALIGGWNIGTTSGTGELNGTLYYGTFGADNSVYLIPAGTTTSKTIAGRTGTDWVITAGKNYGVSKTGILYATGAQLSGDITTNQKLVFVNSSMSGNGEIKYESGTFTIDYSEYSSSSGKIIPGPASQITDAILTLASSSLYNKGAYADKMYIGSLYMQGNIYSYGKLYVDEIQAPTVRTNVLSVYEYINGDVTANGKVISTVSSGEAQAMARNSGSGNRIYLYSNSSGTVGIYSFDSTNAGRPILARANNSNAITAYGEWRFNAGMYSYNGYGQPIVSDTTDTNRISHIKSASGGGRNRLEVNAQYGYSGYASISFYDSSSDIRLKENIGDCTISALPVINAIRMRQFDWRQDGIHQSIGVIADELEEIDNKLSMGGGYTEDGTMNVKSVDTFYLMGYLVKAVQELSAEVNRLKGVA